MSIHEVVIFFNEAHIISFFNFSHEAFIEFQIDELSGDTQNFAFNFACIDIKIAVS